MYSKSLVLGLILFLAACGGSSSSGQLYVFTFDEDDQGWIAGFADLPADYDQEIYQLAAERRPLPSPLSGFGMYIQGINRSDDLFMYYKHRLDGLMPNTLYSLRFTVEFATEVAEGLIGVGGSPGESVYLKAGASAVEPTEVLGDDGWLRLNIDKGNQSTGGEDMIVLGTIGSSEITQPDQWVLKVLDNADTSFTATSDENGSLWLIVGTDSGFEGLTRLYYSRIEVALS